MNYSTTYIAGIVSFLTLALPVFGIEIVDKSILSENITQVIGVLAIAYSFYGRYKAGGLSAWGFRLK